MAARGEVSTLVATNITDDDIYDEKWLRCNLQMLGDLIKVQG